MYIFTSIVVYVLLILSFVLICLVFKQDAKWITVCHQLGLKNNENEDIVLKEIRKLQRGYFPYSISDRPESRDIKKP